MCVYSGRKSLWCEPTQLRHKLWNRPIGTWCLQSMRGDNLIQQEKLLSSDRSITLAKPHHHHREYSLTFVTPMILLCFIALALVGELLESRSRRGDGGKMPRKIPRGRRTEIWRALSFLSQKSWDFERGWFLILFCLSTCAYTTFLHQDEHFVGNS